MSIQTWLYQQTIVISLPDLRDVGLQTMALVKSLLLLADPCRGPHGTYLATEECSAYFDLDSTHPSDRVLLHFLHSFLSMQRRRVSMCASISKKMYPNICLLDLTSWSWLYDSLITQTFFVICQLFLPVRLEPMNNGCWALFVRLLTGNHSHPDKRIYL